MVGRCLDHAIDEANSSPRATGRRGLRADKQPHLSALLDREAATHEHGRKQGRASACDLIPSNINGNRRTLHHLDHCEQRYCG
jgi:hypothetical protein